METVRKSISELDIRRMAVNRDIDGLAGIVEDARNTDWLRVKAVRTLGSLEGEKAVDSLIKAAHDKTIQISSIGALGEIGGPKAVEYLTKLFNESTDKALQIDIGKALEHARKKLDEEFFAQIKAPVGVSRKEVKWAAASAGNFMQLSRGIAREVIVTKGDVQAMSRNRDIEGLIGTLNDPNPEIRSDAAYFLGCRRDERAVEPLIKTLKEDKDPDVRRPAADSLGRIRDGRATEPLGDAALNDPDEGVRWTTLHALKKIRDEKAVGPAMKVLNGKDEDNKRAAARVLGAVGNEEAVEGLIDAYRKTRDERFKVELIRALGETGSKEAEGFLAGILDARAGWESEWVRSTTKTALKHLKAVRARRRREGQSE